MIYVFYFMFCEIRKFNFGLRVFSTHAFVFVECFRNLHIN